jgi:hypothetical protein
MYLWHILRSKYNFKILLPFILKARWILTSKTWPYIYIYTHTYIYIYIHLYTYLDTYINTYINAYIHIHIHTYINTYIYTYIHIYIHAHIQTYIHTKITSLTEYDMRGNSLQKGIRLYSRSTPHRETKDSSENWYIYLLLLEVQEFHNLIINTRENLNCPCLCTVYISIFNTILSVFWESVLEKRSAEILDVTLYDLSFWTHCTCNKFMVSELVLLKIIPLALEGQPVLFIAGNTVKIRLPCCYIFN